MKTPTFALAFALVALPSLSVAQNGILRDDFTEGDVATIAFDGTYGAVSSTLSNGMIRTVGTWGGYYQDVGVRNHTSNIATYKAEDGLRFVMLRDGRYGGPRMEVTYILPEPTLITRFDVTYAKIDGYLDLGLRASLGGEVVLSGRGQINALHTFREYDEPTLVDTLSFSVRKPYYFDTGAWFHGTVSEARITTAAPVPEPGTMVALGLGALAMTLRRRKKAA